MTEPAKILLIDDDRPEARPFTRFRSIFSLCDGIYTTLERLRRFEEPGAQLYYYHADADYERLVSSIEGVRSCRALGRKPERAPHEITRDDSVDGFDRIVTSEYVPLLDLLDRIPERLETDLKAWLNDETTQLKNAKELRGIEIIGDAKDLHVHSDAEVLPGSVFDTRGGPIILDRNVQVSPFCYIEGPAYVGPDARLDNLRLTGGCVLGRHVRAGGEIENSIFDRFSNKHHEGFVGHSILGRWVNLGALTTTSDLKNNYGEIRLRVEGNVLVNTGRIKFGSLVGDCVKTAIGTMLNTGTVIDAGANVFGGHPEKYVPPLAWGPENRYDSARFLSDCEKIFKRRGEAPAPELAELVRRLE